MSIPKEFWDEVKKYTVWTSDNSGDLFKADKIIVDDDTVSFYLKYDLIRKYKLSEFMKNNRELFEGIQIK